jgi:inhibitor of cysteine peptidase
MKTIFLLAGLFVLLLMSGSSFAQVQVFTPISDTSITINNMEPFDISLESNRTTGYSWSVSEVSDDAHVMVLGSNYMSAEDPGKITLGKGGVEVWRFKAISPGNVKLMFYYARPWESVPMAKTLTINVTVK